MVREKKVFNRLSTFNNVNPAWLTLGPHKAVLQLSSDQGQSQGNKTIITLGKYD